jgi:hypothetical protein
MKCINKNGHAPDQQGYCWSCGIPMNLAYSDSIAIVCLEDGEFIQATSKKFTDWRDAENYIRTINADRMPQAVAR